MPEEITTPVQYASAEDVRAWKSPEPLKYDYVHSDTGQTFRIEGITQALQRKSIYAEIRRLVPVAASLVPALGYEPTEADITDACWCAECVAIPKITALQWLQFGKEASLGELLTEAWIASRIIERRNPEAISAEIPDGIEAAKAELKEDPLV